MKNIIWLLLFAGFSINAQNCEGFKEGVFEMTDEYGTVIIEKKGIWQLEKSIDYGMIYLNKIEKINDCKYELHRYKILKPGLLPISDSTSVITTEIIEVKGNNFYFESTMAGVDFVLKNKLVKKSDEISDEFKTLILKENEIIE